MMRHAGVRIVRGWGQEKDKQQAAEAGFNAHLTKPVEPDILDEVLATDIDADRARWT